VVLLVIGGLLCAVMAAVMGFAFFFMADAKPPTPEVPAIFRYIVVALFVLLAAWPLLTAVGIWKLRPWGRTSLLLFSGMLVFMQGLGAFMFLFLTLPETDPQTDQIMRMVRISMTAFYVLQVAIGVWWLIAFSRPAMKLLFAGNAPPNAAPERPLSITVIAWHFLVGSIFVLVCAWYQWPAVFLGVVLHGWPAVALFLLMAGVTGFLGLALLEIHPRAVDWSIYYFGFFGLQGILGWVKSDPQQIAREIMKAAPFSQLRGAETAQMPSPWISLAIMILSIAVPLWYLVTRRAAYQAAARAAAEKNSI